MSNSIAHGVWPTMITLFTEDGKLDFARNAQLTDRLIRQGANGLFAVCQSSEMFFLTPEEKLDLAKCVVQAAQGRVQVIASGHTDEDIHRQIDELGKLAETGVDALVLVTNRLARREDDQEIFLENLRRVAKALPGVPLGIYECPWPFLRLLSLEELREIARDGRFFFLKDVSCNAAIQHERGEAVHDTKLGLYNANAETLFNSFPNGYVGFNGIMGNFHIDIYRWYYENWQKQPDLAAKVQAWFAKTSAMATINGSYPVSAKYHLNQTGLPCSLYTRAKQVSLLNAGARSKVDDLVLMEGRMRAELGLPQE